MNKKLLKKIRLIDKLDRKNTRDRLKERLIEESINDFFTEENFYTTHFNSK